MLASELTKGLGAPDDWKATREEEAPALSQHSLTPNHPPPPSHTHTALVLRKDQGCSLGVAVWGGVWSVGGWYMEIGLFCSRLMIAQAHTQAVATAPMLWPESMKCP